MLGHSLCLGRTGNALGVMRVAASLAITFLTPAFLLAAPQLPDPRPDARIEALKKKYDDELRLADQQLHAECLAEAAIVRIIIIRLDHLEYGPPSLESTAIEQKLRASIKNNPRLQDVYDIQMYDKERAPRKEKP